MELTSGSRVAVVGGGPAGSFSAYFLLDLAQELGIDLVIDIYEPKEFFRTGPTGCNMCGGIISESLVQLLAAEGIHLPPSTILDTIDSYTLHSDRDRVRILSTLPEKRIASIFRGGGPRGAENQRPLPWDSFDWFLLQLAGRKGANHIPQRVVSISRDQGHPLVVTKEGLTQRYDLLIGAVGLNSPTLHHFSELGFGYQPPRAERAFICELYFGHEQVAERLNHSMHIFLLDLPKFKFAALSPKGHYATLIILGEIDDQLIHAVLSSPELQSCLPPGWELPVTPCQCQPHIYIGPPTNPFTDRMVMVGDCSVSRLYKDGIGAAFRTAKALATTALTRGISRDHFQRYFWPTCQRIDRDNRLGHLLFDLDARVGKFPALRQGMLNTIAHEQTLPPDRRPLSNALWDTFTGSAPYREIFRDAFSPRMLLRLGWEVAKSVWNPNRTIAH